MSTIKYQPHIDGLRALAVISVIIFHMDEKYLPGGFLGVDIFFVISGFLITSIIYTEKIAHRFSFKLFYVRRAKRILPPLFFMLLLTLAAGYVLMLPYDYYKTGISSLSVISFVANMQYSLRTGDYFSGDSSEWPLLHTWSLSVEEQYYFTFPVILFLLLKFNHKKIVLTLCIIALLSFCFAEYLSRNSATTSLSYYFLLTRMGELLIGSILAILKVNNKIDVIKSNVITGLCIFTVLFLLYFIDENTHFPGFIALALCLPIAIIINSKNVITTIIFESKPALNIGLLSYSLYLFHWPVLAYIRYLFNIYSDKDPIPMALQFGAVGLTVLLSLISYKLIESPLRRRSSSPKNTAIYYFALPSILFACFSSLIIYTQGLPGRLENANINPQWQYSHIDKTLCPGSVYMGCKGGQADGNKKMLVFGNSHGAHYFTYLSKVGEQHDYEVELYASGGCSLSKPAYKCKLVREGFENILNSEKPDLVIVAFRWDKLPDADNEIKMLKELLIDTQAKAARVVVLAQPPLIEENPSKIANCIRLNLSCPADLSFVSSYPNYNHFIKSIALESGVDFFDPYEELANKFESQENGKLYYFDRDHLSVYGNLWLYFHYKNNHHSDIFTNAITQLYLK